MSNEPQQPFTFTFTSTPEGVQELNSTPRPPAAGEGAASSPPSQSSPEIPEPATGWQRAVSFSSSMVKFVSSGFDTVSREAHDARLAACADCKHRDDAMCVLCGCWVDKKAWMPHEDCPIGRWPKA